MLPNVIIGGVQKAGSTSLFRYLSIHPSVCQSSIKEVNFFLRHNDNIDVRALNEYKSFFSCCSSKHSIRLEASPQYLMQSSFVAKQMYDILPKTKLIFILREPVSVLCSYIKFKSGISKENLSLQSFISEVKKYDILKNHNSTLSRRLQAGCYANHLKEFLKYFPEDHVGVFFYDLLAKDSYAFMREVCDFINIDGNFYKDYEFAIENKTRSYKFENFHKFAAPIYMKYESFFNRHPHMRNTIRSIYHSIGEASENEFAISKFELEQIQDFYKPFNRKLCSLLKQIYPDLSLPNWLNDQGN
jgi:hypothetical protein